ncbi:hypothetical protein CDL12_12176 [Handroanthus impetiginosus]|uniref:Uncharacterized protein n=1 Tax=Handroanthus impetiginosus TaxID=429701 RepID=A0A2G9HCD1_9LAMI|nr:hypothetical protein CDL12_12176 [Handroanthus impetiginosus]
MGKVSVIIYITVAIVLLLLISRSSNNNNKFHGHRHRHRRLKIRSNFTFTPPADPIRHHDHAAAAFDPLVADIERKREDKQWEHHYFQAHHPEFHSESTQSMSAPQHESSEPEWEDFMDAEDYLNDEEKFNVTNRLVLLFPKIDGDPPDGYVTENELTQWNLQQSQREVLHRTQREMEVHDKNKDGFVSYAEYDAPSWAKNSVCWNTWILVTKPWTKIKDFKSIKLKLESFSLSVFDLLIFDDWILLILRKICAMDIKDDTSFGYDIGWWKEEHFNASDADGDSLLNLTEFNE